MAYLNGGLQVGISLAGEQDYFPSKYHRYLLVQKDVKSLYYLMDGLLTVCDHLDELLRHLNRTGGERLAKTVVGRIMRAMAIRYTIFSLYPQQFGYRGDLIFLSNWCVMQEYLQRVTKVAIINYGYSDHQFYNYKIPKAKLYKLSQRWYDAMMPVVQSKIIPHHHDLLNGVKRINQYKKVQT